MRRINPGRTQERGLTLNDTEERLRLTLLLSSPKAGLGRRIVHLKARQAFFTQGTPADCVFYIQSGRAKLTVVSQNGKEATITLLSAGQFTGEESIAGPVGLRMATATAIHCLCCAQD